jgi:hypothetical protein
MTVTGDRIPPRALPLLYFGTAHVSLALALFFAACWPHAVAGFFYHAWLVGLVHLVTLGWITFSILGAMYVVGPLALRMELQPRRMDYVAYGCGVVGLIGMVGHFWIQEYPGMAWSAATIAAGVLYMTGRFIAASRRAMIQPAVKLHVVLACVNFWLAASMGLLIAFDKFAHFLPGFVIANVFAHAHLAALGWATMMVVGVGYRMLPMFFPSKMATPRSMYASAVLLEVGVLGLFWTLLLRSRLSMVFGIAIVAGLVAFATRVVWMRRHMVSKPVGAPRPDFGLLHAAGAAVSLVAAATLGLLLLYQPSSPQMLHIAAAYGVFGLIGFLGQMVTAMEARLLPMGTWYWAYAASDYRIAPPSPHTMRDRRLQTIVFSGWTIGVPVLAGGMFVESADLVRLGAWALFTGVTAAIFDNVFVVIQAVPHHASATREIADESEHCESPRDQRHIHEGARDQEQKGRIDRLREPERTDRVHA